MFLAVIRALLAITIPICDHGVSGGSRFRQHRDRLQQDIFRHGPVRIRPARRDAPALPPPRAVPAAAGVRDLDLLPADRPGVRPPVRRGRSGARARRRGCRGGQRWRAGGNRRRDELLVTSLNIQSLLPKILPLRRVIADTGADIIVLSETWLKPRVPNRLVTFPGYQLIRADRADGRGFGGRGDPSPRWLSA